MKSGRPDENPQNARWDENDPLWRLLGEAPKAEVPAWFTAQTLARCRQEGPGESRFAQIRLHLVQIWRWALAGGLATTMAVALVVTNIPANPPPETHNVQEAFEVVASMDNDSDSSSPSSWQDQAL